MKIRLCLVRCKTFSSVKYFQLKLFYEKENIIQIFVLGSRKYTGKVFSVFGHACKSIFPKKIFLHLAPQCKTFYRKMPKKYTYITIEHLKIPIHIIYAHPLHNSNHKKI